MRYFAKVLSRSMCVLMDAVWVLGSRVPELHHKPYRKVCQIHEQQTNFREEGPSKPAKWCVSLRAPLLQRPLKRDCVNTNSVRDGWLPTSTCGCKSEEVMPLSAPQLDRSPILVVALPASNRTTPRSKFLYIDRILHGCVLPVLLSVCRLSLERILHLIESHTISSYDHLVLPTGALSAVGRSGSWVLRRAG
jgi:hypothetical protein